MYFKEKVARGVALLDEKKPGWYRKINLVRLQLSSCTSCVLGQLYGDEIISPCGTVKYTNGFNYGSHSLGFIDGIPRDEIEAFLSTTALANYGFTLGSASSPVMHPDTAWTDLTNVWVDAINAKLAEDEQVVEQVEELELCEV